MKTMKDCGSIGLRSAGGLLVAMLAGPAAGQVTTMVSVDSGGTQGNDQNQDPSVSLDGRYVAFHSLSTNLVGGDTNGAWDAFVHDRLTGVTERVSVSSGEAQGIGQSMNPKISGDGRYVVFSSDAANLVGGDTNGTSDIFVRDRQTGTTERVNVSSSGEQANSGASYPAISADGRYVGFHSGATNLDGVDTNGGTSDVYVHDRQIDTTERVSVSSGGAQGSDSSFSAALSGDGRYVAFNSYATNLVSADTNGVNDNFVHDRQTGVTTRVTVRSNGTQANDSSQLPSISADGRYVTFASDASNLVGGDANDRMDVFVHDRDTATTERVSVTSGGVEGNGTSSSPSISSDGRYVSFSSDATNLFGTDANGFRNDVFVHDRQNDSTECVSFSTDGEQGNHNSFTPSISGDGRFVSFYGFANNLVDGDANNAYDVFLRDRSAGIGWKYCTANANSTGISADISASGSASASAGDLTLTSAPVPNQNGIFFHGMSPAQIPFGNGFMCTSGGITRGSVIQAVGNVATYTYDNSDAAHRLLGFVDTTRHFQYWFRDPMGGGALFSTSNAMSIAVLP